MNIVKRTVVGLSCDGIKYQEREDKVFQMSSIYSLRVLLENKRETTMGNKEKSRVSGKNKDMNK